MTPKNKSYKESAEDFMKDFDRTQELAQKEKDGTLTSTDTAIGTKASKLDRDLVSRRLFQTIRAAESKKTDSLKAIILEIVKKNPSITHSQEYNYARSELIDELENNYQGDVEIIRDSSSLYTNRIGKELPGKHIVWYRPNGDKAWTSFNALRDRLREAKKKFKKQESK